MIIKLIYIIVQNKDIMDCDFCFGHNIWRRYWSSNRHSFHTNFPYDKTFEVSFNLSFIVI